MVTLEETLKVANNLGVKLMGDNYLGFKYVGDHHEFWNKLLFGLYAQGEQTGDILNEDWLTSNKIDILDFDNEIWGKVTT